jgi:uncharacterized protein (DUF305 family)
MFNSWSSTIITAAMPIVLACSAVRTAAAQSEHGAVRSATPTVASVLSAAASGDARDPRYTQADVLFMQQMIGHHAQALAMASLVPSRSTSEPIHLLAQRIEISQRDEIALMRQWLIDRGKPAPDPIAPHEHGDPGMRDMLMPGMLSAEQMAQLSAAKGADFDRLFLRDMIQHHQGALTMVSALFSTTGAGQETAAFRFASDAQADQSAEIERMRAMLQAMTADNR